MARRSGPPPCLEHDECGQPSMKGYRRCYWHWVAKQPLPVQQQQAIRRREKAEGALGYVFHARMAGIAPGARWCSGCQRVVPDFYVQGSRCKAHSRMAARASHIERTYDITAAEADDLLQWQGGRCFICGRKVVRRNLAVDHDHVTNAVRGLLCSDSEFGCNVLLRRLLGDRGAAERLLAYVAKSPLDRMRAGEPPWDWRVAKPSRDDGEPPF
jgi:hypothetical protein